jgi:hypothetical protein
MVTKKENYDAEVIYRFAAALVLGSTLMAAEPASAAGGGGYGPNARRGPWGHCRNTPYYGRLPNGSWKFLPTGYWHGPWGHCRNTPYHGRLLNGGWKQALADGRGALPTSTIKLSAGWLTRKAQPQRLCGEVAMDLQ